MGDVRHEVVLTLRVFVDTSALFSAVHAVGSARDLVDEAADAEVELIISSYVLTEVTRNLAAKSARGLERLNIILASGTLVMIEPDDGTTERVARLVEPKDAPIVAAAMAARAPIVATYDQRHLVSQAALIRSAFGVEVLTPTEVLRRLATDDQEPTP